MDALCTSAGANSSIAFCEVGDAEKAETSVREAARDESKRLWEVGNGEEVRKQSITEAVGDASAKGSYGELQQFCEGLEADEKLPCENTPVYAVFDVFQEVGDAESDYWVSPRISFSQDFVMGEDPHSLLQSAFGKVSSERRSGERDINDNYSAEFAFLKEGPPQDAQDRAKGLMLSADELFFDGKLLPLPFPSIWAASDDLDLPSSSSDKHGQELAQNSHNRPMSRHLSFDIPKPLSTASLSFSAHSTCPSSSALPCESSQAGSSLGFSMACTNQPFPSLSSSPSKSTSASIPIPARPILTPQVPPPPSSSSMSLPPTPPAPSPSLSSTTASTSSLPPTSSIAKCSAKLKDFFRSKKSCKDVSPPSQLTSENSITSTCKLPLSSRSFWPFSRSNSAGVSKSTAAPPLPCRSNSAGESHTCSAPSPKQLQGTINAGPIPPNHRENAPTTKPATPPLEAARAEENANFCSDPSSCHGADICADTAESRILSESARSLDLPSSSKISGKKVVGALSRGSPGRRKGVSGSKAYAGKIVLRNLERCSAEKKIGKDGSRGLSRRGSFPVGARVSPVLNVAVYRGPSTSKIGFFGFNALLFSKKEKPAADQAAINWRNGA